MSATPDFEQFRAQFPTTLSKTYLNSGSYGLLADSVRAAMERYLSDRIERGADWAGWVGLEEDVRRADALEHFRAVQLGHPDVEQQNVRSVRPPVRPVPDAKEKMDKMISRRH